MQGEEPLMLHGVLLATIKIDKPERQTQNSIVEPGKGCTCWEHTGMIEQFKEERKTAHVLRRLYVTIDLGTEGVAAMTRPVKVVSSQPSLIASFRIYCAYETPKIMVRVRDEVNTDSDARTEGRADIPAQDILSRQIVTKAFDLTDVRNPHKVRGKVSIKLEFQMAIKESGWGKGIRGSALLVPSAFFKETKGNKITLYQDPHVLNKFTPKIPLSGGRFYEPGRYWEDLYTMLCGAKHLIYIAGWSIDTRLRLVPDTLRLGDLLRRKADEGVRVLLLLWDDGKSAHNLDRSSLQTPGTMRTHNTDTLAHFRESKVLCVLCPRNLNKGSVEMFTHHQMAVVVDVEVPERKHKLISFVGGIGLCDKEHSLFKTLGTVHKDDMHQSNFEDASIKSGGPPEPWHDVHAMIDGPAAWDVLTNFEQRWRKQAKKRYLLSLKTIPSLLPSSEHTIRVSDRESWKVQIFRSIDEGAVDGFPEDFKDTAVVADKQNIIERSIQDAYICAIRRAKHFIYMENQYFLGSSASWSEHKDVGAIQLIPIELTLKIIRKIEAGERFAVYVVVPMWPEGVPESECVQEILNWQHLTMEMMYRSIAKALKDNNLHKKYAPTDYLSFFCLGNREGPSPPDSMRVFKPPTADSNDYKAQTPRRFMVFVNSKTMIVDDEYIIVGSANCNQRSMDGARDSEIAMGAYQPYHVLRGSYANPRPRGQIYGFRMSLWCEHLGEKEIPEEFKEPESIKCVKKVQSRSNELWSIKSERNMLGHLLPYPIKIEQNGKVTTLEGFENFPDTKASVLGKCIHSLEEAAITSLDTATIAALKEQYKRAHTMTT